MILLVSLVLSFGSLTINNFESELEELTSIETEFIITNESTIQEIRDLQSEIIGFKQRVKTEEMGLLTDFKIHILEAQINGKLMFENLKESNFSCENTEEFELAEACFKNFYSNTTFAADKLEEFVTKFPTQAAKTQFNTTFVQDIRKDVQNIILSFGIVKIAFEDQCSTE